ncbi:PLP-dependent aminotransferase family protein [Streptomyces sp. BI20]|uniref:MocR-like transcription factor YczR n=1 Tax=Streptomyces sp. BI20 TaxID=3403460 RepID=UPI003C756475
MAGPQIVRTVDSTLSGRRLTALLPEAVRARPGYRHLADAVRTLVLDGRIGLHTRLPAERDLAEQLGVSRVTVTSAYDLLRESGWARSRRGAGTWIELPDGRNSPHHGGIHGAAGAPGFGLEHGTHARAGAHLGRVDAGEPTAAATGDPAGGTDPRALGEIDMSMAAMAEPEPGLVTAVDHALEYARTRLPEALRHPGYHPFGLPELRAAIAERYTARGLPTRAEQILVTSGAQQAMTLVTDLFCRPGDRVAAENPTYANALDALRRAGARTVPIAVSEEGWDMEIARATLRQAVPRLVYSIPDFQNPTGLLMPTEDRITLVETTRDLGSMLVVDETITDMALDAVPPATPAALVGRGRAEHVISVGGLSKSHWGGLRVGWIRTTTKLVAELAGIRVARDMTGSVLEQLMALPLLATLDATLPERLDLLRERRAVLVAELERHLPEWSWKLPPGGLSLWVDIGEPVGSALAERAAAAGVFLVRGNRFGMDPGTFEHRLRIPYTQPAPLLREAVRRLAGAFHEGVPLTPTLDRPGWVA